MFKTIAGSLAFLFAFAVPSFGQTMKADKEKSKIEFVGKKPDGKHTGGFKDILAEAKVDMESPEKSSLTIEIKTESLFSDNEMLTQHLRGPDFFDIKKYPTIKFESTKIEVNGEEGTITGKLTLLGKTEEIKVPMKAEVSEKALKVIGEFKIDRTKFGMTFKAGMIENEVPIKAELVFPRG